MITGAFRVMAYLAGLYMLGVDPNRLVENVIGVAIIAVATVTVIQREGKRV